MIFKRKTLLRYVLPILTIMILIGLLTVALLRLATIQREMRHNTNANMVWVIYYAHLEGLRLTDTLQKKALEPAAEVEPFFRYQMLLSRLNLLHDGPQARFLNNIGLMAQISLITTEIQQLESLFIKTDLTVAELAYIQEKLAVFSTLMLKASTEAMTTQWDELGDGIDMNRNAVLAIIFIFIGILFSSIFISAQLLMALKRARESDRIKQREIELKKQLEQERKMNELHRSFSAMVSHQFRTPLAIIDASMQRLQRAGHRMSPVEVAHRASKAKAATERLTRLIESVLNADQLTEQANMRLQSFCLVKLTQQIIAEQYPLPSTRIITFSYDEKAKTKVMGDPILTTQIILNLLSNAEKYSIEHSPISIHIYQDQTLVCCTIKDLGRGIPSPDVAYVFQRYFRSDTVSDVIGTGIGLYVAAELASLQQGRVSVVSEVGVGSTFKVCLPLSHGLTNRGGLDDSIV